MELFGYSERGLVNALCYDCVGSANGESLLAELLQEACFPLLEHNPQLPRIQKATFLVEQSLSQFGDCDLIILCDSDDETKFVIYCEFKRGRGWSLKDEWMRFDVRIKNGIREKLTSNLFCQLYLKQRFTTALVVGSTESIRKGLEFDVPLNINKGMGHRKIGKNSTVLDAVSMIEPYAIRPYFLMVTPQEIAPGELKLFLQETNKTHNGLRGWSSLQWGHLSLSALKRSCEENRPDFDHALSVFKYNEKQLF